MITIIAKKGDMADYINDRKVTHLALSGKVSLLR